MGNWDSNQIREFGTGLRDYLELHGARLDVCAPAVATADLFALFVEEGPKLQVVALPSPPVVVAPPAAVAA